MEIRPIKTEADYQAALDEIECLFDAEPGTPEGDRLEVLTTLIEAYEDRRYSLPMPQGRFIFARKSARDEDAPSGPQS